MRAGHGKLMVNADFIGGGLLVTIAAIALWYARGATFQVWVYPRAVAGVMALLGSGLVAKGFVRPERREIADRETARRTVLPFAAGLIAYALLFSRLGFVVTTIAFYGTATWVLRRKFTVRSAVVSAAIGAVLTLVLYQLFTKTFHVPLPTGTWW